MAVKNPVMACKANRHSVVKDREVSLQQRIPSLRMCRRRGQKRTATVTSTPALFMQWGRKDVSPSATHPPLKK
jgi:hypothetical protein